MTKKNIVLLVVLVLLAGAIVWYYVAMNQGGSSAVPSANVSGAPTGTGTAATSTAPTIPPVAGPGEHCGGNIANAPVCGTGYECVPNPASHLPFGDVGGICAPHGKG